MLSNPPYPVGTVITGKWRGNRYVVERLLGKGANGTVYLVQREGRREKYALKVGNDTLELQSEINVLTTLQSCRKRSEHRARRESPLSSYLLESDDFKDKVNEPFYVMRYVEGRPLHHFLARQGASWLGLVGLRVLEKLEKLHECGFVFGDLKPENVMVSDYGEAELIDYGGASPMGRSVKQFTEWHDRGFWNAGSRTGDESYDLFSFAVLCLRLLNESALKACAQQLPQTRSVDDLMRLARNLPDKKLSSWLCLALKGGFPGSAQAAAVWKQHIYGQRKPERQTAVTPRWLKNAFAISLFVLAFTIYWVIRF
ncbi:serine/threonine protein kinase [Paenibacillus sp. FSL R7-0273]|uniref:serine/threonine protein kinase n=1 Tax=Paenibacillus sp. FSL R7-0273 TaxID=1536772 RepID=UPI0004F65DDC|nr:serine/threonine protein kinase [Paenibacillus sp. FSL R7-0273]AIQ44528.1 serine/threonine protein kinase [Paenibacillus sp. FSL R7-0273]OMF85440.1 serine/threonine protein kinase [Paenibacillus sp. FSL R7-0273]